MNSRSIYFLLILVFFSCNNFTEPKPKNLLDRETITNIFYDLALIESAQGFLPRILSENKITPKEFIYKKYKIDSLDFVQNNKYYASDVKLYQKIYEDVHDRITEEKENIQSIIADEAAIRKGEIEKLKLKE